jgi:hypothetical protein
MPLASDSDQLQRRTNILIALDPEADPARARKKMVRQSASITHQLAAIRAADEAVQQAVPVNVAGLFPAKKETDTAETMDAAPHAGPFANLRFDFADRPKTRRMKQAGRAE